MNGLRYALRSLWKSPAYTAIALLTLALGIGVNTSMVSLVNTLLFRAAPYPDAEQLVLLEGTTRNGRMRNFSEQEIREIREQVRDFSSLTVMGFNGHAWAEPGQPAEQLRCVTFSAEMMDTFRVPPLMGRTFSPEEFLPGKNHVVLLNEHFWRTRYAADPNVIGRTMRLDGEMVTIIGVMPTRFDYKMLWGNTPIWRPLNFTPEQMNYRAYRSFLLLGRLKNEASAAAVVAQLAPLASRLEKEFPQDYPGITYRTLPLHKAVMDDVGKAISWMLLGLAAFILLIACANLANLQLARATASVKEFAIRAALGASTKRLLSQQLTESVVLSLAGGLLGIGVARTINLLLERNILIDDVPTLRIPIDMPVLIIALLVSVLTGMLFGIVPAVFAARTDINGALKAQSRGSTADRHHHRMRHLLIIGEIALALVLLSGAAVMNRGFNKLLQRHVGWDTKHITTVPLPISEKRYPTPASRTPFFEKLEQRLQVIPGADHVALSTSLPLFNYSSDRQVFTEAMGAGRQGENPLASHVMITSDYFASMGIPLLQGRNFAPDLKADSPEQIIVNQALAQRFWPGENPLGKRLGVMNDKKTEWKEVVGVVGDVEPAVNISNPPTRFTVYKPLVHEPWSFVNVVVRSENPAALTDTMRRAIAEVDPDLSVDGAGTVRQFADRVQHNLVVVAQTMMGFALLGLVLAAVGLYGVISNIVAQRTSEFGIRLALGARPENILSNVLNRGLRLAAIGVIIGLAGSWALNRYLASVMPRLASLDYLAMAGVATMLLVVTLIACWFPARRATRVDPMTALRAE